MGGQRSTIASHPERAQIEARLRKGDLATHIAADFGLSRQAVSRAKTRLLARPAGQGDTERDEMRRKIQNLYNGVLGLVQTAHEEKNPRKFLAAVSECRKCLGLLSKILGVLDATPAAPVSVTVNIDIEELKQVILVALAPHPRARLDVAAALAEFDDRKAGGEQ